MRWEGRSAWLPALAEDGQHPSVDAVGLGQGAGGLGEQARAQRIDDSDSEALRNEAAMGGAVELSVASMTTSATSWPSRERFRRRKP